MSEPGDIVEFNGEHRVVVDVADYGPGDVWAVLRHLEGDQRRGFDSDGGDMDFVAVPADSLTVVDHI